MTAKKKQELIPFRFSPEIAILGLALPETPAIAPYSYYENVLSPPECETIIELAEKKGLNYAQVGTGNDNKSVTNKDYRTVGMTCLELDEAPWLYNAIGQRVRWTNDAQFKFDIMGFGEKIQFLRYDEQKDGDPPGHYDWHQDFGGGNASRRKLSVMIQLDDPETYEGCELKMFTNMEFAPVPQCMNKGAMIVFPSFMPHRVTSIIKGTRRALVTWIHGPPFR